jgi:hypothetical protein
MLVVYLAAGLAAGLVAFARLPGEIPTVAVAAVWIGAFLICRRLGQETVASVCVELVTGIVFVMTAFYTVHASTLAVRGVQVQATVTDISTARTRGSTTYSYRLAGPDGHPVKGGRLAEQSSGFDVGDKVTVIADPDGLVAPEKPGEVATVRRWWIANGSSFAATVLAVLWAAWRTGRVTPLDRTHSTNGGAEGE